MATADRPSVPSKPGGDLAVVLRIHVLRDGGHAYYVDDLVPGRAEGTLVTGEEPGHWWGAGAAAMGQRDQVDASSFAQVLAGRDPVCGDALRARRADRSVAGYDLTFAAPKSVSILHLLAPRELAAESGAAHRVAVSEALGYLERAAVGVRRVISGEVRRLPATGMVAGIFLHRTSRALDPHLHTHAVAANVAQGVDGLWSAVDSRRVFAHARAAQAVYHARLRLEIGVRLGGTFEVAASGLGDVLGVDRSLCRLFSQRAATMDEYRYRRMAGRGLGRSSRGVFHATRPDKDRSRTVDSLVGEWRERAALFGIDLGDLTSVVGRSREIHEHRSAPDHERAGVALEGLARHRRSVARHDLVAAVAVASTAGASADEIESVVARLIERAGPSATTSGHPDCRALGRGDVTGPELRWRSGELLRAWHRESDLPAAGRTDTELPFGRWTESGRTPSGPDRVATALGRRRAPDLGRA